MKTKIQKTKELKKGKDFLEKSKVLVFIDFTDIAAEDLRRLRGELKKADANFLVIKKRLLNLLTKEKGIDFDIKQFKLSLGTVFSKSDTEKMCGTIYKFFSSFEIPDGKEKNLWIKHILGGYDLQNKNLIDAAQIVLIGKLPPREVLLGQLLGVFIAPVRSFLYLLSERSKKA